jgi:dolichyl-phosphate-mannose-protein mannosyltransferase
MDMEVVKRLWNRFWHWEYSWLCLIVAVTLILHLMIIAVPNQPLFDEQHYVPDARTIINSHYTNRTEHPPLAKLFMVGGMYIFGDNPWGWRMPSVIVGTLGLVFFYLTCRNFKMSRRAASLGAFILGTENLYFVHSGIAMLDIYTVSFTLLAFWLYSRRSYPVAGVAVALAALTKFNGVFAIFAIIFHWLLIRRDRPIVFVASLLIAGISFFLLLAAFDAAIYLRLIDFITSLRNALQSTSSLTFVTAAHPSMSRPWEWIFNLEIMPYWYGPHFIGLVSFSVWALIVPTLIYMTVRSLKKNTAALFGIAMFAGTYLPWIPLSLITNRVSFIFYFLPTVPAICFGLAMGLDQLISFWQMPRWRRKKKPAIVPAAIVTAIPGIEPQPEAGPSVENQITAEIPAEQPAATITAPETLPLPPTTSPPVAEMPPEPPLPLHKWWRKSKLQWLAISFVVLFFLVHLATFVIVAPPLNNWPIERWFS